MRARRIARIAHRIAHLAVRRPVASPRASAGRPRRPSLRQALGELHPRRARAARARRRRGHGSARCRSRAAPRTRSRPTSGCSSARRRPPRPGARPRCAAGRAPSASPAQVASRLRAARARRRPRAVRLGGRQSGVAVAGRLGVPAVATLPRDRRDVVPSAPGATAGAPRHPRRVRAARRRGRGVALHRGQAPRARLRRARSRSSRPASARRLPFRGAEPDGAEPRILFVGRLNPQKGRRSAARGAARGSSSGAGSTLEVIGGGPSRAELEALAARLGVADRVTFHGPLPRREDVVEALRRAHVLVMPSRAMPDGPAEGSPVVTKEAQAVGVPLVATDTGGIAETVPPEHRGDLVPGDDPAALAPRVDAAARRSGARARRARRAGARWVEERVRRGGWPADRRALRAADRLMRSVAHAGAGQPRRTDAGGGQRALDGPRSARESGRKTTSPARQRRHRDEALPRPVRRRRSAQRRRRRAPAPAGAGEPQQERGVDHRPGRPLRLARREDDERGGREQPAADVGERGARQAERRDQREAQADVERGRPSETIETTPGRSPPPAGRPRSCRRRRARPRR